MSPSVKITNCQLFKDTKQVYSHNFVIEYSVAHKNKYHIFLENTCVSAAPGQNFTEERKNVPRVVENMVINFLKEFKCNLKTTLSMQCILFYSEMLHDL